MSQALRVCLRDPELLDSDRDQEINVLVIHVLKGRANRRRLMLRFSFSRYNKFRLD